MWGSFWKDGQWGFQCCHSVIKNSYCTGERSKDIEEEKISSAVSVNASKVVDLREDNDDDEDDDEDSRISKHIAEEHVSELSISRTEKDREALLKSEARRQKKREKKKKKKKSHKKSKGKKDSKYSSSSESDEETDKKKKLLEAVKMEEKRIRQVDRLMSLDERKRPYNSMVEAKAPNEEELEAYYMKRKRDEDPMVAFM